MRRDLTPAHFVEIGIGCESCHGGSREHIKSDRVLPDFVPRSAFLRVRPPSGAGEPTRAEAINRTCARCHQVLFSRYAFTWEGGVRRGGPVADWAAAPSPRARRATSCSAAARARWRAPPATIRTPRIDATSSRRCRRRPAITCARPATRATPRPRRCARTRTTIRRARAAPASSCHMPRKNMGLGYALTRYHRIGSPTDAARVERDRPLECALCHADRSVASLVGDMERLWGKRYDRAGAGAALRRRSECERAARDRRRTASRTSRRRRSRCWARSA